MTSDAPRSCAHTRGSTGMARRDDRAPARPCEVQLVISDLPQFGALRWLSPARDSLVDAGVAETIRPLVRSTD